MKTIRIEKDGLDFVFYCESRDTRNGFAHDCRMVIDYSLYYKASCYYLNRTWEVYQYQSVCLAALRKAIQDKQEALKASFMEEHNYKRLTRQRKEALQALFDRDQNIIRLNNVKDELRNKVF